MVYDPSSMHSWEPKVVHTASMRYAIPANAIFCILITRMGHVDTVVQQDNT